MGKKNIKVRVFREAPFCWQSKTVLRLIEREYANSKKLTSRIAVYTVLTQIASDSSSEEYKTWGIKIMEMSGVGYTTLRNIFKEFEALKIIKRNQARTKKGTYGKLEISLVEPILTDSQNQPNGKTDNKISYNDDTSKCQSKEDNLESSSESNKENSIYKNGFIKKYNSEKKSSSLGPNFELWKSVSKIKVEYKEHCEKQGEKEIWGITEESGGEMIKVCVTGAYFSELVIDILDNMKRINDSAETLYYTDSQIKAVEDMLQNEKIGFNGIFRAIGAIEFYNNFNPDNYPEHSTLLSDSTDIGDWHIPQSKTPISIRNEIKRILVYAEKMDEVISMAKYIREHPDDL